MSSRKDMARTTPSHSGDMSNQDVKRVLGVPPLKRMGQLVNVTKEKAQEMVEQFQSAFARDNDGQLPGTKKRAGSPNHSIPYYN